MVTDLAVPSTVVHSMWGLRGERDSPDGSPKAWAVSYRIRLGTKAGIYDDHIEFSQEDLEGYAARCSSAINVCLEVAGKD